MIERGSYSYLSMKILSSNGLLMILLLCSSLIMPMIHGQKPQRATCINRSARCFLRSISCPQECPFLKPIDPKAKACYVDCNSRSCTSHCKRRVPNCNGFGAACYDPRFVGGDGVVFFFRGRSNEHFSLVSDPNLQINARFIGLRPPGRSRDFTWIQALGILFGSHNFSLEATKATTWDDNTDHLKFSYDDNEVFLPEGHLSVWNSPERKVRVERISSKNSVILSLPEVMEIAVNARPVTKEDDKIHNYHIPSNDCFVHLEVQFRFFIGFSPEVEGVLGRTYRPGFKNPAKTGVSMPVVGGEDKYRTTSLFSADCKYCLFSPIANIADTEKNRHGNGIVFEK